MIHHAMLTFKVPRMAFIVNSALENDQREDITTKTAKSIWDIIILWSMFHLLDYFSFDLYYEYSKCVTFRNHQSMLILKNETFRKGKETFAYTRLMQYCAYLLLGMCNEIL